MIETQYQSARAEDLSETNDLFLKAVSDLYARNSLAVPGIDHATLRFAFHSGLRLTSFAHLWATAPLGRMEQYLPSGPSLYWQ